MWTDDDTPTAISYAKGKTKGVRLQIYMKLIPTAKFFLVISEFTFVEND